MNNRTMAGVFPIVFLLLLVVIAYGNSLSIPFIVDDYHMIEENIFITQAKYLPLFFKGYVTSYQIAKGMCRPILMVTFFLNYQWAKLTPWGYHLVNALLHFGNAVLLFFLIRHLLFQSIFAADSKTDVFIPVTSASKIVPDSSSAHIKTISLAALLSASVFAVHPLNTEAVSYVSSRSDLLVTFFILGGMYAYFRNKFGLVVIFYCLGLLTKETGVCLFLIIGATVFCYQDSKCFHRDKRRLAVLLIILLLITGGYIFYRYMFFSGLASGNKHGMVDNVLIQSLVLFYYFKLFFFPYSLGFFHSLPELYQYPLLYGACFAVLIFFVVALFRIRNAYPLISFGMLWVLCMVLPKFYAQLNVPAAEHHFYLASIGIYVIFAKITVFFLANRKKVVLLCVSGIAAIFLVLTLFRNYEMADPQRLWRWAVARDPRHPANWLNLGVVYKNRADNEKAKNYFENALAQEPRYARAYNNLGNVFYTERKWLAAIAAYQNAIAINSNYLDAYNNLALTFLAQGKISQAKEILQRGVEINPYYPNLYNNLGAVYTALGEYTTAEKYFDKALSLNPAFSSAYVNKGVMAKKAGNIESALQLLRYALELNPYEKDALYNLGVIYQQNHKVEEAEKAFRQVLSLDTHYTQAYNNLGVVYLSQGRIEEALRIYLQLQRFDPANREMLYNLGIVYTQLNKIELAIEIYARLIQIDPEYVAAYNNLAGIYVSRSDFARAVELYEKIIAIDPGYALAYGNLAVLYFKQNDFKKSLKYYKQASLLGYANAALEEALAQIKN